MSAVLHRHCSGVLPTVDRGEGVYLYDVDGNKYLDACGGAAVSSLGHQHPELISSVQSQLTRIAYAHTGFFTSPPAEQLAAKLANYAGESFSHTYLVSGGSEAVESAIKLARQYYVEQGKLNKSHIIARRQSFHGNTLGALANGGNQWRRAMFSPLFQSASLISPCYAYREKQEGESEASYGLRVAQELETEILNVGADRVMAFIAEPVVGATGGAIPAVDGYFQRIRDICDRYDVLLILDEVMCGVGRTGTMFAFEQLGVTPDMVTVAKGLSGGSQPLGAVVIQRAIVDMIANGSGFFQHGHTFIAHATACAAGCATLDIIEKEALLNNVKLRGEQLQQRLKKRLLAHPHVGDIRGVGLLIGIELVENRKTKAPFPSEIPLAAQIKREAMNNGLMCYPMGGTIDGRDGHHILLAPPYIISEEQLGELVNKLLKTLETVLEELKCLP